jgi:lipid A ethanolaminephosphotransferase
MAHSPRNLHLFTLVALICLYNLIAFQGPLLAYALRYTEWDANGAAQMVSLQVLQLGLLGALLLFVAMFSIWAMKLLTTLLFLGNAAGLHFMNAYGVELDLTMMRNIFGTNTGQVGELMHWTLYLKLVAMGLLPSVLVWVIGVRSPRLWLRLLAPFAVFGAMLAVLFATSTTWLWYDKHATRMGARILPWSYLVNTGRYFNKEALRNRVQVLLPDAQFIEAEPAQKEIVVLVIGEAARAENFSHYGYERDTNPFTKDLGLVVLPMGKSCATYTIGSVACIITHEGREASARTEFEPLPSYLTRHGIETIWRSNSGGTPPFQATVIERVHEIAERCRAENGEGADCPSPYLDGALVHQLGAVLAGSDAQRILVVLHQTGSHGPSYSKKYPPQFAHFTPVCDTVQVSTCSEEALYNAYDNTIRYTDYLLSDVIAQLQSIPDAASVLIYTADHGQSLGENGLYLHGSPPAFAPDVQRYVPFFVWMSDRFQTVKGITPEDIMRAESHVHDFPFHSVMGAFGMRSDIYKPQFDIFAQ